MNFRNGMILGRVLRFQGRFKEALVHLRKSFAMVKQLRELCFDEDLRDLTCDIADTLRELDELQAAEECLREELARWDRAAPIPASTGRSLIEASLAEVLFAQGRYEEAQRLCLEVESRGKLMKLGELRISIIQAKIHHIRSSHQAALSCWIRANGALAKFPLTNGHTLRIVLHSLYFSLVSLGHHEEAGQTQKQLELLGQTAKPGGTQHWIAGMGRWQNYLDSGN